MTVAHEIRYPWWKARPWPARRESWDDLKPEEREGRSSFWREGYRESFITIWHVDPERGGSDDSCGFSYPRLNKKQLERLKYLASDEASHPYFMRRGGRTWVGSRQEAEALYRGLVLQVAWRLDLSITFDEAAKHAAEHIHHSRGIDGANTLCFEPGYHSNSQEDTPWWRERHFHSIVCGIARELLRARRPWYRHPRWHLHHWKIQVHSLQTFKRWAFSRCCSCGKRFTWGYCPTSDSWHGTGPCWFRGEKGIRHNDCASPNDKPVAQRAA